MAKKSEKFEQALVGTHVPPLALDNKWYRLFKQAEKTEEIEELEEQLKHLLKEQGRINDERKKLKALKSKLMDEIMAAMDSNDPKASKKKEENSKLIDEINQKMDENEDLSLDLPREIDQVNKRLMLLTMEECYKVISENTTNIQELDTWITETRIELKKNIVKKQEKEIRNIEIYSYMHDIFGPEVIELFDITYDIEGRKQEILAKQRALKEQKKVNNGANTNTGADGSSGS